MEQSIKININISEQLYLEDLLEQLKNYDTKVEKLIFYQNDIVIKPTIILLLNGIAFELQGCYKALLNPGDKLTFLMAYTGG